MRKVLIKIIYEKYNSEFHGDLLGWLEYLKRVGIERKLSDLITEQGVISLECPHSIQSRIIRESIWFRTHLFMSEELAEKIAVFGEMP